MELKKKAYEIRRKTLEMIYHAKTGHTGGALSETDILTTLFYRVLKHNPKNPNWEDRDRFILSKGHSVEPYFVILSDMGYFDQKELETFSAFGTKLIGHPNNKVDGIEVNSGALGHGLSVGVGMALAGKKDNKGYRVFVLMGDGELAEGSVWEAAMSASHYKLDNLCAIIDRNRLQITGATEDVMNQEPLKKRWEAFGFDVVEVDGHNYSELEKALNETQAEKPRLIIAHTTKGKGISFIENQAKWHHGVPDEEQFNQAIAEINEVIKSC